MNNAPSYVTGVDFGSPDERYAGPLGKLLLVAKVQGVSTSNLGGLDIEAELRARMQTSGPQQGRFSDVSAFGDFSNGFGKRSRCSGSTERRGSAPRGGRLPHRSAMSRGRVPALLRQRRPLHERQ